jgi:8-oxo-dGTP pyrophosphatase MutT (NUDIX family)
MSSPEPSRRIGPWSIVSTRAIYANPWIEVRENQVLQPDGKPGIYGVVSFRNAAIGVVPIDAEGRVTLVGQHRFPLDYYSWEIPEGGSRIDEDSPEATARRELSEETGIQAQRLDYLGCFALSNSVTDEVAHLFLARELTPGESHPEGTEVLQVRTIPFAEACRLAEEGELTESLTVIALLRARHFLLRESQGLPPLPYRRHP